MKHISSAILFGFKEVFSWHTMKYILLSGAVATLVWIAFGYLIWDGLISMSAAVLEMVPFSLVRSNGAWMLSTFLWFQLTLVTFALIFAFGGNLLLRTLSKEKYSTVSILTLLGSALFWGVVWFFKGDYIYAQFLKLLTWLPFETIEKGVAFLIGFYIIYNAIVVTMLFFASLFSEPIIEDIELREFEEDDVVKDNMFKTIGYTLKDSMIFIAVSVVAFPLLFVPVLNIFVQIALWIWLTKNTISYDALSLTHENVDKALQKQYGSAVWIITAVTVLFYFVPVLNIFGPYFGTIALFAYFKSHKAEEAA
ncbi:MAG: EI24 domain-containing protein [Sulfurovum sp.]|nr:EI24 domain-containing protein [Sulfurovum sp.]